MKTTLSAIVKTAAVAALLLVTTSGVYGQAKYRKSTIPNLIQGIKSDNPGLSKSSIYLSGKYQIPETVETLAEELKSTNDTHTKMLISMSLYQIGTDDAFKVIYRTAKNDSDERVKNLCSAMYTQYFQTEAFAKVVE